MSSTPSRAPQLTADGSQTLALADGTTYHSAHGAVQESAHVFIRCGLHHALPRFKEGPFLIFEMGFGTGLNALLTAREAAATLRPVVYHACEPYPLSLEEAAALQYTNGEDGDLFLQLHQSAAGSRQPITDTFSLHKQHVALSGYRCPDLVHLIYFDAFAPTYQPALWTVEVFQRMRALLVPGGFLLTYCSKGSVRRAMTEAGLQVEKLPGPKGKREIVRAKRPE